MPSSIFIIDSSPAVRRMVEQISVAEGFEVIGFQDGPAALEAARRVSPALIIADYHLENMTFSGFCKEVNKLEHLTETLLVSLLNAVDRPDKDHLRTLGVNTFLNKPFQSDDLLEIIKSLQDNHGNGQGLKRRVWPPMSSATDSDEDQELLHSPDVSDEEGMPMVAQDIGPSSEIIPSSPAPDLDATIQDLFRKLVQSFGERTEQRVTDLVPAVVEHQIANQIRPLVHKELNDQLGPVLSHDRLGAILQPLVRQALPALIRDEMTACQPIIRQVLADLISDSIKDRLDHMVREQVDAGVKDHLPGAVREHHDAMTLLVKEEVRQATMNQAPLLAEEMVRSAAARSVDDAVARIVPELAEQHIKAELKRLTDGAEETSLV